jgi:hypothetical protein
MIALAAVAASGLALTSTSATAMPVLFGGLNDLSANAPSIAAAPVANGIAPRVGIASARSRIGGIASSVRGLRGADRVRTIGRLDARSIGTIARANVQPFDLGAAAQQLAPQTIGATFVTAAALPVTTAFVEAEAFGEVEAQVTGNAFAVAAADAIGASVLFAQARVAVGQGAGQGAGQDDVSAVPLPAGLPMLLAGLGALGLMARRKKG